MANIKDFLKNRKLTETEENGVQSRLAFAGYSGTITEADVPIVVNIVDKIVEKMRYSKRNMEEYSEQSSTLPKSAAIEAEKEGLLTVSLVNNRLATFNSKNNVVMPIKKTNK